MTEAAAIQEGGRRRRGKKRPGVVKRYLDKHAIRPHQPNKYDDEKIQIQRSPDPHKKGRYNIAAEGVRLEDVRWKTVKNFAVANTFDGRVVQSLSDRPNSKDEIAKYKLLKNKVVDDMYMYSMNRDAKLRKFRSAFQGVYSGQSSGPLNERIPGNISGPVRISRQRSGLLGSATAPLPPLPPPNSADPSDISVTVLPSKTNKKASFNIRNGSTIAAPTTPTTSVGSKHSYSADPSEISVTIPPSKPKPSANKGLAASFNNPFYTGQGIWPTNSPPRAGVRRGLNAG